MQVKQHGITLNERGKGGGEAWNKYRDPKHTHTVDMQPASSYALAPNLKCRLSYHRCQLQLQGSLGYSTAEEGQG